MKPRIRPTPLGWHIVAPSGALLAVVAAYRDGAGQPNGRYSVTLVHGLGVYPTVHECEDIEAAGRVVARHMTARRDPRTRARGAGEGEAGVSGAGLPSFREGS